MNQTLYHRVRCEANTLSGSPCSRNTIKHARYCWQHTKQHLGVHVKTSTIPNAGQGLFASRDLNEGTRIQYARPEDYLTRAQVEQRYGNRRGDYVVCEGNHCLDARSTQSGHGRYTNDARNTHKRSNSRLTVYHQGGQVRGNVRLTKKVKAGQEILTSYGRSYWGE